MNKLTGRPVLLEFNEKVAPYRPYRKGDVLQVVPDSQFSWIMRSHYPKSNGKVLIDSVCVLEDCEHDYVVRPVGYGEELKISHYHVRPLNLTETRMFVSASDVLSGVVVRDIKTSAQKVVKLVTENVVVFDDGSRDHPGVTVEILKREDDADNITFYLRPE
jgi:hypothetical protein